MRICKKEKVTLVVVRPITTSAFVQESAVEFANWAHDNGVAVVFVRNFGQGRREEYFAEWDALEDRNAAIPPAIEVMLPDLGAWIGDEATALGLSLADIATARFDRLSEKARHIADRKFGPEVQLVVADYLEQRCVDLGAAIDLAIDNLAKSGGR
jgi:hypothetical protein